MRRNPERLAWTILLMSFGLCVFLAISVPLAVRSFIHNSTDPADLSLDVQQGTALLRRPNSTEFVGIAAADPPINIPEGSEIRMDPSAQGVLTFRDPRVDANLVVVQLSVNTRLTVQAANRPRFDASSNPYQVNLELEGGRIRVNVLNGIARPVAASVEAPQGNVTFSMGTYAIEVTNDELQVTVREGRATVSAQDNSVVVNPQQRARVELGQSPQGGLSGERPLIVNGNFTDGDPEAWGIEHDLQVSAEAIGRITFGAFAGRRAALFERNGRSHAETRLVQMVDRDVTGAASLTLHFSVLINSQDVPVCGTLGSECPMMVKINYRDTFGTEREWLQGFYYLPDPNPNGNPPFCVPCNPRNPHQPVSINTWYPYDSGNLMDLLAINDAKPAYITRITFYASGHSYRSAITDVELLLQD
ncbi:MAG TPA: FecR domain-containing protein [Anaerolineae bacterium]